MKCTYNWLQEFINFDYSPSELAEHLTMLGLEVDSYETVERNFQNAVAGRILEQNDLNIFVVDIGEQKVIVKSKYNNLKIGQRVVVNKKNDSFHIASYQSLNISDDDKAIYIGQELEVGSNLKALIPESDIVFDIDVTPNRPDCLSVFGIAREISNITENSIKMKKIALPESDIPASDYIKISNYTPEGCPRYAVRMIKNVSICPSPLWMHNRLALVGLRAINNIVDTTNYVMMELGHPLHAFDYKLIKEQEIQVRLSESGEQFVTLDGKRYTLDEKTVLICDAKRIVALGGIMGGLNSEVSDSTRDVLVECAYFNPGFIRSTTRKYGISTDASMRFSRGADPNGVKRAINRTAQLIGDVSDSEVLGGIVDNYAAPVKKQKIPLRVKRVEHILGTAVSTGNIKKIMESLGCEIEKSSNPEKETNLQQFHVVVPTFRPDLTREIDLIEEISRVVGYDNVPEKLTTTFQINSEANLKERYLNQLRDYWVGNGFSEAIGNSMIPISDVCLEFYGKKTIKLKNPLSEDMAVLRPSMIPSLLRSLQYNLFRQQENIRLFEIGTAFEVNGKSHEEHILLGGIVTGSSQTVNWINKEKSLNYYDLKGLISGFFKKFRISNFEFKSESHWALDEPGVYFQVGSEIIGHVGSVKKEILDKYDISSECFIFELNLFKFLSNINKDRYYVPVPRFPAVQRDLAFVIDLDVPGGKVMEEIKKWGGKYLKDINIFDVYTGQQVPVGKKSVAVSLVFQAHERTFTESEINKMVEQIISKIFVSLNAELRT